MAKTVKRPIQFNAQKAAQRQAQGQQAAIAAVQNEWMAEVERAIIQMQDEVELMGKQVTEMLLRQLYTMRTIKFTMKNTSAILQPGQPETREITLHERFMIERRAFEGMLEQEAAQAEERRQHAATDGSATGAGDHATTAAGRGDAGGDASSNGR